MFKIKFGIIGSGKIVEEFLQAANRQKDFEFVAMYSRDISRAKGFGKRFGARLFFDNLEEFAKSEDFDAVYITSPNAFHCKHAVLMLKNKKHVLCEKAFATNVKEVDSMIRCARENNVLLVEAMRSTSSPGFIKLKENLYKIGTIRRYFASYCQYSSRYDDYKEKGIIHNIFNREMGAGALMDIGVYCIAPMINLFGIPESIVSNAYIMDTGIDGQGSAIFDYGTFDASILYSKISNSKLPVEIQGEEGIIIADNIRFGNVKIVYKDGREEIIYKEELDNDMFYEIDDFINSIKLNKKESDINKLETSRKVIEILDRIRKQIGVEFLSDK